MVPQIANAAIDAADIVSGTLALASHATQGSLARLYLHGGAEWGGMDQHKRQQQQP